jgi:exodeoxyribonuclease V gamma subunit
VAAKHRLAAWVRLLALTATSPQHAFSAATVGRGSSSDDVRVALVPALAGDPQQRRTVALEHLTRLVELYDRGMNEPLPIFCKTSAAYAEAAAAGRDPLPEANRAWESTWMLDLEDRELEHRLVLGGVLSLQQLLTLAPCVDESGEGWAQDESSRLGRYARRLWDGLLEREQVSAR